MSYLLLAIGLSDSYSAWRARAYLTGTDRAPPWRSSLVQVRALTLAHSGSLLIRHAGGAETQIPAIDAAIVILSERE